MVFVTPLALLMNQLAHRVPPGELRLGRAAATALGSLVGVLVVLATRRWPSRWRRGRVAVPGGCVTMLYA